MLAVQLRRATVGHVQVLGDLDMSKLPLPSLPAEGARRCVMHGLSAFGSESFRFLSNRPFTRVNGHLPYVAVVRNAPDRV